MNQFEQKPVNVVNNLTSDSTTDALSAAQGKALNSKIDQIVAPNAGSHNSIYRGKYLGTSVANEQWAAIKAGTFDGLFIGDYWTINNVNWRIAAFDYWYNCGNTACTTHHVVIVPDSNLTSSGLNSSNITTGGYAGTDFYTAANSNAAKATVTTIINSAFGSGHILSKRASFSNATEDGKASNWGWYDSTIDLMNACMVYGSASGAQKAGNINFNVGIDKSQLPLFCHDPSRICNGASWWLRDVVSDTQFANVNNNGLAASYYASWGHEIRPAFGIYQA